MIVRLAMSRYYCINAVKTIYLHQTITKQALTFY
jgi:hypothetical protein